MPKQVSITQARKEMGPLFSEVVVEHRPALIERHRRAGVFVGEDDASELLSPYEFHTEVFFEPAAVSFWVPELALYGRGATYEEAGEDLVEEIRDYIEEYWSEIDRYRKAPNRASHFPYLMRAHLADRRGELLDVLLAEPSDAASATREAALASA